MAIPNIILLPGVICSVFIVLSVILYQQINCINSCTQHERLCEISGISFQKESSEIKDLLQMRNTNAFLNFVNSTKRYRISKFNINDFKLQDQYIKCYNINNKPSLDYKCVT